MKNLKIKLAAGVVAVSVIGHASMAFANVDVAQAVQNWFGARMGTAKTEVQTYINTNVPADIQKAYEAYDKGKVAASIKYIEDNDNDNGAIQKGMASYENSVEQSINSAKDSAIQSVNFQAELTDFYNKLQNQHVPAMTRKYNDFYKKVDGKLSYLRNKENKNRESVTNTANNAKTAIEAKIAAEKAAAIQEINNALNDAIKQQEDTTNARIDALLADEITNRVELYKGRVDTIVANAFAVQ